MTTTDPGPLSMSSSSATIPASDQPRAEVSECPGNGQLLQQRLALVEDLWQTVLRSECPADQAERLLRMKQLSDLAFRTAATRPVVAWHRSSATWTCQKQLRQPVHFLSISSWSTFSSNASRKTATWTALSAPKN